MQKIDDAIWVHGDSMRLMATSLGLRMTVVRLADGSLWVHSPTALTSELLAELEQLGPVSCIVAASNGHNRWVKQWSEAFPDARLYVSCGVGQKLNLVDYYCLDDADASPWPEDFELQFIGGVPFFSETVFLHKPSASLVVTDLVQNHSDAGGPGVDGLVKKWIFRPMGFKDICLAPPIQHRLGVKDRAALAAALDTVAHWPFTRIIPCHGDMVENDSKQVFDDLCAGRRR